MFLTWCTCYVIYNDYLYTLFYSRVEHVFVLKWLIYIYLKRILQSNNTQQSYHVIRPEFDVMCRVRLRDAIPFIINSSLDALCRQYKQRGKYGQYRMKREIVDAILNAFHHLYCPQFSAYSLFSKNHRTHYEDNIKTVGNCERFNHALYILYCPQFLSDSIFCIAYSVYLYMI